MANALKCGGECGTLTIEVCPSCEETPLCSACAAEAPCEDCCNEDADVDDDDVDDDGDDN